ncbi:ABC transporter ATP-binding protein [Insulibacter thermoxylanivorax]
MPGFGGPRGPMANLGKPKVRAKDLGGTIRKLWRYLAVHKWMLILVLFMVVVNVAMGLLGPYVLGLAVDNLVYEEGDGLMRLIICLGGIYAGLSLSAFLQNYWMIGISQKTVYTMRKDLFRRLHLLPIDYFVKRRHGELMSRITNDIDNVSQTLNSSFIQIFSSVLTFAGMLVLMAALSPLLTLVTLLIVPLMLLGMRWITSRTGRLFKEQQRHLGELNGYVEETVSGQRIVKLFSQEKRVIEEFMEKNRRLRDASYWAQVYSGFIPKLMNVLNNASFAIIAAIGGWLTLRGVISVGTILVFAEYARQFTRPLNDLANQFNTLLSAVAGAERVFEVMEEEPEFEDHEDHEDPREKVHPQTAQLQTVRGEIRFENVSFSYDGDEGEKLDTLQGIDLHVKPGETMALVGPTGAGKTTITSLLARFYDPQQGRILIDGLDITTIARNELRRLMGFVLQDTFLFTGTIRENIRYGRLDASDEEVERAAKLANAHSFIIQLPQGYDTVLTQDAADISQGQRQLLAIARAILADPAILILDEATSSIDTITEIKIQEALYRLMQGRTSIVVAHRLNTIQNADQIVVLHQGRIIERGTHQSLLAKKGYYHDLYQSQFTSEAM